MRLRLVKKRINMGTIIYRHYKSGDDQQLANLFNITFQQGGGGVVRTLKSWTWKYVQSPGFKPKMCQIAEDIDKNIIAENLRCLT